MKTRAKKTPTVKSQTQDETVKSTTICLDASVQNPPRVFVLAKDTSLHARIITIGRQDAKGVAEIPNRYFACPEKGFYEITKIAAPKKACRSWLMTPERGALEIREDSQDQPQTNSATIGAEVDEEEGYMLANPDLFVATTIDPMFIMLSLEGILWYADTSLAKEYFALSDLTRTLKVRVPHLRQMLEDNSGSEMEKMLEQRAKIMCDELTMGDDEAMYAFSLSKLAHILLQKAARMVKIGLPASMEEHFVTQVLEVPVLSIRREDSSVSIIAEDAERDSQPTSISQNTNTSMKTTTSISTIATSVIAAQEETIQDVRHLLRIRTALNHILAAYLPAILRSRLEQMFNSQTSTSIDFAPLDKHLTYIASLKTQAQALRSISDNVSRKRGFMDDEEAQEKAEAKKRKREEEEAKKKNVSHGLKKLMKADTSGMKKLSSFFAKGAVAKKS